MRFLSPHAFQNHLNRPVGAPKWRDRRLHAREIVGVPIPCPDPVSLVLLEFVTRNYGCPEFVTWSRL